ncbi:MAG: hypothetical protein HY703_12110, partial [Gemmatimonadetes bacterium]|nr:hypothetical protein [Gemmatimonadota bacterium]
MKRTGAVLFVALLAMACRPAGPEPEAPRPVSARERAPAPALPPIPPAAGPLRLDLVYPPEGAAVTARDSTFVFGSTGTGEARLWINGAPVAVAPNGAFLGFLPVPADG